jgi:hypothetical protein
MSEYAPDGLLGQPSGEPGCLAVGVVHPPQLALHCGLDHAPGGEVERRGGPADALHPVHRFLPVRVLPWLLAGFPSPL